MNPDYKKAWLLFMQGQYWEAHEVWEKLWRESKGEARTLLHALVQLCALGIKIKMEQWPASERLRLRIMELLFSVGPQTWTEFQLERLAVLRLIPHWQGAPEEFEALLPAEIREAIR